MKAVATGFLAVLLSSMPVLAAGAEDTNAMPRVDLSRLPRHPRILLSAGELPAVREKIAAHPWAKARFEALRKDAETWLARPVNLPSRGGQWYHWYSCPKHGARLRTEGPTRHVCPVGKEVYTGYPYDDVVISMVHDRWAEAARRLAILYQITGENRYGEKAREILRQYAAVYTRYPLHTIRGEAKVGGGRVGPQTLDESTWILDMAAAADGVWPLLDADEQADLARRLFRPAAEVIRSHKLGIHNIQCWKNSAVGVVGLLLADEEMVREALYGPSGFFAQMKQGLSQDGAWYEGAWGYHFYAMRAVSHLTEAAFHSGLNLYTPELKRMFDAPLVFAMPDLKLPAFNDSHTVSLAGEDELYEIALVRYRDPRYRAIVAPSRRQSDEALLIGPADPGATPAFTPGVGNFPESGYAVLAAGSGSRATWLGLDYGPHGGGHGHPDKLGFVLYAQGRVLAPDPGTANYGVPIQGNWYRTTLAHSTLSIDEASQQPADGRYLGWLTASNVTAVMAEAGKIAAGLTFRRTAALVGSNLVVFIDQVTADRPHTLDLAFHAYGKAPVLPGGAPFTLPDRPGYNQLRDTKALATTGALDLAFVQSGVETRWAMAGETGTTFIAGTGVGGHTEDRVPMVIARRQARDTAFLWALSFGPKAPAVSARAEPIVNGAGIAATSSEAAAVRVRIGGQDTVVVANPGGLPWRVAGRPVSGRIIVFDVPSP